MKKSILTFLIILVVQLSQAQKPENFKALSFQEADLKADSILQEMSLDEKLKFIGGDNFFYTQEIKRLGIPSVPFVDATQGIRINPAIINQGWKKPVKKTIAYPSPILLASSWNKDLAYAYAHSIGEECKAANLPLLLGPGMNIYRNSQCGRNFEYFGEDPYLAGKLIEYYVKGLQETGTIATLKHFVANQTDYYRRRSNSILDERTLHEIYMPAFKSGIDAGAKAVMTSYNLVNGEWAGQSEYVIKDLLRKDLDFKWLVMTDWFSVWDGEKVILSGQDLEMPFSKATKNADRLLEEGKISEEEVNRMVKSILRTFISMHSFEGEKKALSSGDYERLEEVALNTAREGMVLLRNENNLLPIDKSKKQKILLTGEYLDERIRGGGAGSVKGYNNISLKEAILNEFGEQVTYVKKPGEEDLKSADILILCVATKDSEASDRPFNLSVETESRIQKFTKLNPNTALIVTSGSGIKMSEWNDAHSILYTWYMGQNGAIAAAEILSGKTNPSGKLPISIEKTFEESPAYGYIPEGEELYSGFKMRSELKRDVYDVHYNEGVFMGYRWYDSKNIEPLFCFGHGLSYTQFEYSNLEISRTSFSENEELEIKLTIKNTGLFDGAEIVQLYLRDIECSYPRPLKELKAFEKVFLEKGESKNIRLKLKPEDFQFWHPELKKWTGEKGEFEILIGSSSRDIKFRRTISKK